MKRTPTPTRGPRRATGAGQDGATRHLDRAPALIEGDAGHEDEVAPRLGIRRYALQGFLERPAVGHDVAADQQHEVVVAPRVDRRPHLVDHRLARQDLALVVAGEVLRAVEVLDHDARRAGLLHALHGAVDVQRVPAPVVCVGDDRRVDPVGRAAAELDQVVHRDHAEVADPVLAERQCAAAGHHDLEAVHLGQSGGRDIAAVDATGRVVAAQQPPEASSRARALGRLRYGCAAGRHGAGGDRGARQRGAAGDAGALEETAPRRLRDRVVGGGLAAHRCSLREWVSVLRDLFYHG